MRSSKNTKGFWRAPNKSRRTNLPKPNLNPPIADEDGSKVLETPITTETLQNVSEKISLVPEGFHINPKMVGQLARRAKMGTGEMPMDWGFAEAVAIGSIVLDGYPVRLSGQDSGTRNFFAASRLDV